MSGMETSTDVNQRVKHSTSEKIIWLIFTAAVGFAWFICAFSLIQSFGFLAESTLQLKREVGENYVVFSALENTTVYYGKCNKNIKRQKECLIRRLQADFSGDSPKEDECKITLRSESGGFLQTTQIKIEPLGKNRAALRWFESDGGEGDPYHLRFSVVDFSNCSVKTTKLSKDLNQLITNINDHSKYRILFSLRPGQRSCIENGDEKFNKLSYLKGGDDFEVVLEDWDKVYRSSIDSHGVASKVDTILTYPEDVLVEPMIVPLSKDEGYLFVETLRPFKPKKPSITVALIQPNGQRQNLTHVKDVYSPVVSLANGLIGICARQNNVTMLCTQFKLDDKKITWFSANLLEDYCEENRVIYNLPRGEGLLTYGVFYFGDKIITQHKYLVKFGMNEEKNKHYLYPNTECEPEEAGFNNIFEDDKEENVKEGFDKTKQCIEIQKPICTYE
uniref:Uncharacterized protein n=1 Tax=Trichogramma kaykai TaxID=54128 RepID=A0ABD2X4W2_9HYME